MRWWRNIKDLILSFYYPSGQVFLISFPNSGRTWVMHMVRKILKEAGQRKLEIQKTHDFSEIIIEDGTRQDPSLIFNFTDRFRYCRSRVIFLSRDPRDIIVSNFYQVTNRAKNPFRFNSKSEFIKHDIYGFKRVIHFFNIWGRNYNKPQEFLLIKYENLLKDFQELKRIIKFLDLDISDSLIEKVYNESSASKMRKKEKANQLEGFSHFGKEINKLKVRNAKKGSYLTELDSEDIAFCNEQMQKLDSYFGYKI